MVSRCSRRPAAALTAEDRDTLLRRVRSVATTIWIPDGTATLRDQRPLVGRLAQALHVGVNAGDYLAMLNSFVYLFPQTQQKKLHALLSKYPHGTVLTFSSEAIIATGRPIRFTKTNTGACNFDPSRRYKGLEDWLTALEVYYSPGSIREVCLQGGLTAEEVASALIDHTAHGGL